MYSSNVFAVLTPCDEKNKARSAFELPQNKKWFHKATGGVAEEPIINSREPTPAPDASSEDQDVGATDRLIVTFDDLLKELESCQSGLQFGTHLVAHNGQNKTEVRKKDTWLLAYGPGSRKQLWNITIHSGSLTIKIEFPNHGKADPQYVDNLKAFFKRCKEAVPPVGTLGLDSEPTTATPSQAQTPGERPIYYNDGRIGKGAFGEVRKFIKLRNGEYFAAKSFFRPAYKRKRDAGNPEWLAKIRSEFTIMRDNPHPNVMRVFEFRESPDPLIIMDYYEHGNIAEADVAYEQYVTAFGQILDGLGHLHYKGVVHRDLKPENILVEKSPFFKVVITDFGLSKAMTDITVLKTFCGTLKYLAPEAFPGICHDYDSSIDIWATGVVIFEWMYGIPEPPAAPKPRNKNEEVSNHEWHSWIKIWCQRLLDKLKNEEDDTLMEILLHMIETKPRRRWPADWCLDRGFDNGLFRRRATDSLVVGLRDPDETASQTEEGGEGVKTPTVTFASSQRSSQRAQTETDPEATIILGNLWKSVGAASFSSARIESSSEVPEKRLARAQNPMGQTQASRTGARAAATDGLRMYYTI